MGNHKDSGSPRFWLTGGREAIPRLTKAALRFADEHSRLLDFYVFFTESLVQRLQEKLERPEELRQFNAALKSHRAIILEVVVCRVVDNFLCFISNLLALIYKVRPETLRSSEQERIDFILQFSSMDDLLAALADKRVERLAYLGLRDLSEHLKNQMGFELFLDSGQLKQAAVIVELRNLFVHNRGIVSATTIRRFPEFQDRLGMRVLINFDDVIAFRKLLEDAVMDIDLRAARKFSLPTESLPDPPEHLLG